MRPFAASMFRHRCFILPLTETLDATGSLIESLPVTTGLTAVSCRVRLNGSRAGFAGQGVTAITLAEVAFPADPGVAKGWRLKQVTPSRTLRCVGPSQARDADAVLWVVSCEVID